MKYAACSLVVALAFFLSGCGQSPHERSLQLLAKFGYEFKIDDYLLAASEGSLRAVRTFQSAGMPIDAQNTFLDTALIRATRAGHEDLVAFLLEGGANASHKGRYGRSALIHACERGSGGIVDLLLGHGADPHAVDDKNWDALTLAAYHGHDALVRRLFEESPESLDRALIGAAVGGDAAVVQMLLESGANMKIRNGSGKTPLLLAAEHGKARVCQVLLSYGADPLEQDSNGNTAETLAEAQGFLGLAGFLGAEAQALLAASPIPPASAAEPTPKPDYVGTAPAAEEPHWTPVPSKLRTADGLTIRLAEKPSEVSVIPKPLLRDQWPSLAGKVLRLQTPLGDGELDDVFCLREFNYEPALLTFLQVEMGRARVRLAGEDQPRSLIPGDRIPGTSLEVTRIKAQITMSHDSPVYVDRSELHLRDLLSGESQTILAGETRDEGTPYAVISIGSSQQQYWVRLGHRFTLLRPDSSAQDYQVVSLRPSKLEIENLESQQIIPITRQGMANNKTKRGEVWTLGFFR